MLLYNSLYDGYNFYHSPIYVQIHAHFCQDVHKSKFYFNKKLQLINLKFPISKFPTEFSTIRAIPENNWFLKIHCL